jgi:hypothetical protein
MKPFQEYSELITSIWLTQTWELLSTHNMQIEDSVADLTLAREHDKFLLRIFQQSGYKGEILGRLNQCRLFIQASTVADIATGSGKFVTQAAWTGQIDPTRARKYDWPE